MSFILFGVYYYAYQTSLYDKNSSNNICVRENLLV